ncbi:MAG: alpha/beta hydrolase [Variovorax sp.]|nr:MAG: alpha/beta hydrolase [Variovorax sp.]
MPTDFDLAAPRHRLVPIHSRAGDGEMAIVEFGPPERAPDLVMLHANGFNAMTYRQLLAPLGAEGLRVIAADQRGHGLSRLATPAEGHDWRRYADDLVALTEALGGPPRVLAGHSMGGTAILLAAPQLAAANGRAPSMVLFDPVLKPASADAAGAAALAADSPLVRGALRRNAFFESRKAALDSYSGRGAFRTWPDEVIADYLSDGLKPRQDSAQGGMELTCAPAWEAANFISSYLFSPTEALTHPLADMRILRAAHESTCRWDEGATHSPWPPHVRVESVPGTTHFLPMEKPELARAALREAIAAAR